MSTTTEQSPHIVQSPEWGQFKNDYGTSAVRVGAIQYTKHQIPFSNYFFGYCPKVDPFKIDFDAMKRSLEENNCINVNFDVPNVFSDGKNAEAALKLFQEKNCVKSPRDQFATANVILDISSTEDELLKGMHHKQRYNVRYAQKKGVKVRKVESGEDFDTFFKLYKETSQRQKYFSRPKVYLKKIWDLFGPKDMCFVMLAEHEGTPLAGWFFLVYEGVLYYPYGGSSLEKRNLQASSLLAWEGIRLGKTKSCHTFDMWGAGEDPENKKDPWWGFTNFKLRFGGKYVRYIDSYDYVVNPALYKMFSVANSIRWGLLGMTS